MVNEVKSRKSIGIGGILKQSLSLYKENFSLFIGIAILGYAVGLLSSLLVILTETAPKEISFIIALLSAFILAPLSLFITFWASIALIIAASNRYLHISITLKECFIKTKGRYLRYMGVCILYFLVLIAGLLLFVIPGIYWGTIFLLATVACVLEKTKLIGSFKISKGLVRGSFWKVFLLSLIVLALSLPAYLIYSKLTRIDQNLATILVQIYSIFYISFSTVIEVTLYHRLKERKQDQPPLNT